LFIFCLMQLRVVVAWQDALYCGSVCQYSSVSVDASRNDRRFLCISALVADASHLGDPLLCNHCSIRNNPREPSLRIGWWYSWK
jgi:hypothetical protein